VGIVNIFGINGKRGVLLVKNTPHTNASGGNFGGSDNERMV